MASPLYVSLPASPPGNFEIGSLVLLDGLVNRPQLNGRLGEIVCDDLSDHGRWGVRLYELGEPGNAPPLSVHPKNLVSVAVSSRKLNLCSGCGHTFGTSYLQMCRNCRMVAYCSKLCQKQHWPEHKHKQRCKFLRASRKEKDDDLPSILDLNDRIKARVARATRHTQKSNDAAAEKEYRRLIDECPVHEHQHVFFSLLANTMNRQQHLDQALVTYKHALTLPLCGVETPSAYAKSWVCIGMILLGKCDYEGTFEAFKSALEFDPDNIPAAECLKCLRVLAHGTEEDLQL